MAQRVVINVNQNKQSKKRVGDSRLINCHLQESHSIDQGTSWLTLYYHVLFKLKDTKLQVRFVEFSDTPKKVGG
jgi:hypothetical protein